MTEAEVREAIRRLIRQARRHVAAGRLDDAGRALDEAQRLCRQHDAGHDLVANAMTGIGEYLAMARFAEGTSP